MEEVMMPTVEYQVTGMTCSHCERSVHDEVVAVHGVGDVEVSAATGRLVVTTEAPVADEAIIAAVEQAGYDAVRAATAPVHLEADTASSCGCC